MEQKDGAVRASCRGHFELESNLERRDSVHKIHFRSKHNKHGRGWMEGEDGRRSGWKSRICLFSLGHQSCLRFYAKGLKAVKWVGQNGAGREGSRRLGEPLWLYF